MNNVRTMRLERGWQLKELSERSGVPISTISSLEAKKEVEAKVYTAIRLAAAFRASVIRVFPLPEAEA